MELFYFIYGTIVGISAGVILKMVCSSEIILGIVGMIAGLIITIMAAIQFFKV